MAPIALAACSARQRRVRLLREGERLPQRHTAKGCSPWQPRSARLQEAGCAWSQAHPPPGDRAAPRGWFQWVPTTPRS